MRGPKGRVRDTGKYTRILEYVENGVEPANNNPDGKNFTHRPCLGSIDKSVVKPELV
jgi:hypothetical protein